MFADFLQKNQIKTLNRKLRIFDEIFIDCKYIYLFIESINSDQIDLLKSNLKQEINDKQNEIHELYKNKTDDINAIEIRTEKLIEQCEQLEIKRKELIEQIDDYSKLENHARHVNSNYHQVHHLNEFINGIKQLIDLQNQIQGTHIGKNNKEIKNIFFFFRMSTFM